MNQKKLLFTDHFSAFLKGTSSVKQAETMIYSNKKLTE